jgi:hypothetical protein
LAIDPSKQSEHPDPDNPNTRMMQKTWTTGLTIKFFRMKFFSASFAAILALLFISCSPSKKGFTTAAPLPYHLPDTLSPLPVSEIDLPVRIPIGPLLASADASMQKEFTSYGWPAYQQPSCDFRYKYRFVRSGFTLACTNNKLNLQLTCSYQVAGSRCICTFGKPVSPWLSGTCGLGNEPMRRVELNISSQLDFSPDYRIHSRTAAGTLKALDRCVVSMFSQDMTQQILDSIRSSIDLLCTSIDHNVAGLNFSALVRQAAAAAWKGMPIGHYGWLALNPSQIRIGQLNQAGDTLTTSFGLSCKPVLSSDSNKMTIIPALPPLTPGANRDGISLYLQAVYDYSFITKLLNDTLKGRTFVVKGHTVTIQEVGVKGIGNHQVEMMIDFSGDRRGRIYLRGTPVLDSAKQALSLPDISYSLESKDLALKIARSLLRNKIRKSLRGNSYLDIAALVRANLPMVNTQLNRQLGPVASTAGKIREIRVMGLLAAEKTLVIQVYMNANLSIINSGLPR